MPHDLDLFLDDSADELLLDAQDLDTDSVQEEALQLSSVPEIEEEELSLRNFKDEAAPSKGPRLSHISPPPLVCPKSAYGVRPQGITRESEVVDLLEAEQPHAFEDGELELDQFVVYERERLRYRMVSLDQIAAKNKRVTLYFDGQVKVGYQTYYLEHVPFDLVSIGGYEDLEKHSVNDSLWIQSATNERLKNGLWYKLKHPTKEYKPYYSLFLWVAGLAKHLLDYLHEHENICLDNFRADFMSWLISSHGNDEEFRCWVDKYSKTDFRHAIVAHADFLQMQAVDMDAQSEIGPIYENHLLWHEINPSQSPNLVMTKQPQIVEGTIVTPYVRECFRQMEWGNFLRTMEPRAEILEAHEARLKAMGFHMTPKDITPQSESKFGCDKHNDIAIGDVVAVPRDEQTKWKEGEDKLWYAVVQDIKPLKHDARLFVIWLYKPSETICSDLTYLQDHELFLSNHCNCDSDPLYASEVVKKIEAAWFASAPSKEEGYFVRQTYLSEDAVFATLKQEDFVCSCRKEEDEEPRYSVGDTVLVETITAENDFRLEPAEIVSVAGEQVQIRPLERRSQYDRLCRPNELLYTTETREVLMEQIDRKCHVRTIPSGETTIPTPYDRDGTGDFFYIRKGLRDGQIVPLEEEPTFKPGYNLDQPRPKLRALNIFCGGGTFDRGLEEGGCVQSEWAVEWAVPAMLTYRANHRGKRPVKCFCGSVDDYLYKAQIGNNGDLVARLGEVDLISAGSPCQGYSTANQHKDNEKSLRNSSMIASVASYVDFFRPKYAILENVVSMSNKSHARNPLSQLVATFVGMGYQLRVLNLDAWSFGAPQSRSRLFVLIAAPGLELPARPFNSHSHPPKQNSRALGRGPSGVSFGDRHWDKPVFSYVSAVEATKDLPYVGRGRITQIKWPDHRPSRNESDIYQQVIELVPKFPKEQSLRSAVLQGRLRADHPGVSAKKMRRLVNRSWTRINPDGLIPTVTTTANPFCTFTGKLVHWDQDRLITLQEARRAQGYPDDEVLVGNLASQWKIVGNSVARQVALVLGLKIREACENDEKRGLDPTSPVKAPLAPVVRPLLCKRTSSAVPSKQTSNFSVVIPSPRDPAGKPMLSALPLTKVLEERPKVAHNDRFNAPQKTMVPNHVSDFAIAPQQSPTTPDRLLSSPANVAASISLSGLNLLSSNQVSGAARDDRLDININIIHRKRLFNGPQEKWALPTVEELDVLEKENQPRPFKRLRSEEAITQCGDMTETIVN